MSTQRIFTQILRNQSTYDHLMEPVVLLGKYGSSRNLCTAYRSVGKTRITSPCLYVNDICIATSSIGMQQELISALKGNVEIKGLGVPDQVLGLTLSWG